MKPKAPAAPPETPTQIACRQWWQQRLGTTSVGWGRDKRGGYLTEFARNAQAAWEAARGDLAQIRSIASLLASPLEGNKETRALGARLLALTGVLQVEPPKPFEAETVLVGPVPCQPLAMRRRASDHADPVERARIERIDGEIHPDRLTDAERIDRAIRAISPTSIVVRTDEWDRLSRDPAAIPFIEFEPTRYRGIPVEIRDNLAQQIRDGQGLDP